MVEATKNVGKDTNKKGPERRPNGFRTAKLLSSVAIIGTLAACGGEEEKAPGVPSSGGAAGAAGSVEATGGAAGPDVQGTGGSTSRGGSTGAAGSTAECAIEPDYDLSCNSLDEVPRTLEVGDEISVGLDNGGAMVVTLEGISGPDFETAQLHARNETCDEYTLSINEGESADLWVATSVITVTVEEISPDAQNLRRLANVRFSAVCEDVIPSGGSGGAAGVGGAAGAAGAVEAGGSAGVSEAGAGGAAGAAGAEVGGSAGVSEAGTSGTAGATGSGGAAGTVSGGAAGQATGGTGAVGGTETGGSAGQATGGTGAVGGTETGGAGGVVEGCQGVSNAELNGEMFYLNEPHTVGGYVTVVTHLTASVATVKIDCGSGGQVVSDLEVAERTTPVVILVPEDGKRIELTNHTNNTDFAYMSMSVKDL